GREPGARPPERRRAGDAARAAPRHRRHRARGRGDAEPRRLPLDPRRGARGGGRDGRALAPPAPPPARIGRRRRARGAGARGGGRPLPAVDLERLAERRIVVRRGAPGERLTTLDGVERALEGDDLVIADGRGPVALAGVMGGATSEVTPATRAILLESAFFVPASVRRTSRRLALPSQAAYRFERRVDPAMVPEALDAVAALIARLAGGRVAPGIVEDAPGTKALGPPIIRLRPQRVSALLGARLARGQIVRSLH